MARPPFSITPPPDGTPLDALVRFARDLSERLTRSIPRGPSYVALTRSTTLPDGRETEYVAYGVDATLGAVTVTLPASGPSDGTSFTVKKIDASANAVTLARQGTDTIEGATTASLAAQWNSLTLLARAGGFVILASR